MLPGGVEPGGSVAPGRRDDGGRDIDIDIGAATRRACLDELGPADVPAADGSAVTPAVSGMKARNIAGSRG
ncbi:hypothetical protein Manayef4_12145 [Frankia sp. CgMI4]|nr:hypothetical protein Manayef4_12145 [Frankia sp. CgIM4]